MRLGRCAKEEECGYSWLPSLPTASRPRRSRRARNRVRPVVLADEVVRDVDRRVEVGDRPGLRRAREVEDQHDVALGRVVADKVAQLVAYRLDRRLGLAVVLVLQVLAAA